MTYTLVVVRAFGPHMTGDVIDDIDAVRDVLHSEHSVNVVRVRQLPPSTITQEG